MDIRYPKRESVSCDRSIAGHGLNGTLNVSGVRSVVSLTNADPDADKGACDVQRRRCPATFCAPAHPRRSDSLRVQPTAPTGTSPSGRRPLPSQTKRLTGVTGGESAALNSVNTAGTGSNAGYRYRARRHQRELLAPRLRRESGGVTPTAQMTRVHGRKRAEVQGSALCIEWSGKLRTQFRSPANACPAIVVQRTAEGITQAASRLAARRSAAGASRSSRTPHEFSSGEHGFGMRDATAWASDRAVAKAVLTRFNSRGVNAHQAVTAAARVTNRGAHDACRVAIGPRDSIQRFPTANWDDLRQSAHPSGTLSPNSARRLGRSWGA
jgi:hypothetical protein